jgi:uncharacterized protein (DUF885 family)
MTASAHQPPHSAVDVVAEEYLEALAALDPFAATFAGLGGHDSESTDYSPDGYAARETLHRETLRHLSTLTPADDRSRVALAAICERLEAEIALAETRLDRTLNVIDSPLQDTRLVFSLMPTATAPEWAAVEARLAAVPRTLDGYRRTLAQEAGHGRPPTLRQVRGCVQQCARLADGFFRRLVGSQDEGVLESTARARLTTAAGRAEHGYADFARFLEALTPRAVDNDAVGTDRYAVAIRTALGADVDLGETYAWGFAELERIEQEMVVAARALSGDDVVSAMDDLDADPARTFTEPERFLAWMQDLSDRAVSDLADTHFDIPEPVRRLECRIAPQRDGGIYYTGPSEDLVRPGRMWWSVPEGTSTFHTWRETSTVFHEGVPGHHLQVAQTALRSDTLNRWQRRGCWVSGHGEGWALYAERLMAELGWLDDPGDLLGMLDAQRFRAARVCVDIGLHCGFPVPGPAEALVGPSWTAPGALAFLHAHSRLDEPTLRFEVDRYCGWPGQAPSYKVGERLWLQARADAQARHGAAFDLRRFHDQALALGPMGLDPLRAALARL